MPGPASPTPRSRLFRRILTAWFYLAVIGALWWQFGASPILLIPAGFALITALSPVSKRLQRRRINADGVDVTDLHERIFSPIPTEATLARSRLSSDLTPGVACLVFISMLLSGFTGAPFLIVLAAVTFSVLFTGAMLLVWAISRARRQNQFSVATLLILITISAVYLGVIRLLVVLSGEPLGAAEYPFLSVTLACLIMIGFSLPFLLIFMVRLVWLAAWIVRRPWAQRWLMTVRKRNHD